MSRSQACGQLSFDARQIEPSYLVPFECNMNMKPCSHGTGKPYHRLNGEVHVSAEDLRDICSGGSKTSRNLRPGYSFDFRESSQFLGEGIEGVGSPG